MEINTLKMWYGYLLLIILGTLIAMVALGHVNKETSYGLDGLITGLLMLIQQWASWAFNRRNDNPQKPTRTDPRSAQQDGPAADSLPTV